MLTISADGREHRRHQAPGPQRRGGELGVRLGEPVGLLGLAHERPHHPDAGDLLAEHGVHPVDARLHLLERRHHPVHERPEQHHRAGHRDHQHHRQPDVFADREDEPDHQGERRRDHHRECEHHQLLHLRDVVGDAGDQRRCAEAADLACRVPGDLVEQVAPDVATERHRGAGPVEHRDGGERDLDDAEAHHHRADRARCSRCRPAGRPR